MNWTAAEIPGLLMITGALSSVDGSDFEHSCGDKEEGGGEEAGATKQGWIEWREVERGRKTWIVFEERA
jgi:hypothetical protein